MASFWADKIVDAVEFVTGGFEIINSDHAQHHKGNGYKAYVEITSLTGGSTIEYCWTTGTAYCHVKDWSMSALGGSLKLDLLTGATVTLNTGTVLPLSNTNDNTTNTPDSEIRVSPSYTGGTSWHQVQVLGDSTRQNVSTAKFQTSANDEIVLTQNTEYILKIENHGTDTIDKAFVTIFFYEEGGGLDG